MNGMNQTEALVHEVEQRMLVNFLLMLKEAKEKNESIEDLEKEVKLLITK